MRKEQHHELRCHSRGCRRGKNMRGAEFEFTEIYLGSDLGVGMLFRRRRRAQGAQGRQATSPARQRLVRASAT